MFKSTQISLTQTPSCLFFLFLESVNVHLHIRPQVQHRFELWVKHAALCQVGFDKFAEQRMSELTRNGVETKKHEGGLGGACINMIRFGSNPVKKRTRL